MVVDLGADTSVEEASMEVDLGAAVTSVEEASVAVSAEGATSQVDPDLRILRAEVRALQGGLACLQ